jgi:hypothetical protein
MRLQQLKKWLREYDVTIETASRHFMARRGDGRGYTIPAHNGLKTEVPDKYLKALCKHFGIDPSELPI